MLLGLAGCESTYDRKDLANAPWHRKAAEEGNAVSQYFLGLWYAEGRGVRQDDGEAVTWFRKAAEQGIAEAHFYLGLMYSEGRGVPQDYVEAVGLWRKAAEQGDAEAQFKLGLLYTKGHGVPQDDAEAAKWYRKAAEQGNVEAQYNLGLMHSKGRGVQQDFPRLQPHATRHSWHPEAVTWFRKAAEQGYAEAQYNLGIIYATSGGNPDSYLPKAHMWLNIAASRFPWGEKRDKAVRSREILAKRMTWTQLWLAQYWARGWTPCSLAPKTHWSMPRSC